VNRTIRLLAMPVAAGALLVAPTVGQAHHKPGHTKGPKGGQKTQRCKKPAVRVGFVVRGTLTSFTADGPATPANEARVSITVTGANRHARNSGELADTDPVKDGIQVKGGTYTVAAGDAFKLRLVGYVAPDTPSAGDPVRIIGKISRTRSRCAPAGTSLAERYGDVNVRKVTVHDADAD
jgi:hypothetical protein